MTPNRSPAPVSAPGRRLAPRDRSRPNPVGTPPAADLTRSPGRLAFRRRSGRQGRPPAQCGRLPGAEPLLSRAAGFAAALSARSIGSADPLRLQPSRRKQCGHRPVGRTPRSRPGDDYQHAHPVVLQLPQPERLCRRRRRIGEILDELPAAEPSRSTFEAMARWMEAFSAWPATTVRRPAPGGLRPRRHPYRRPGRAVARGRDHERPNQALHLRHGMQRLQFRLGAGGPATRRAHPRRLDSGDGHDHLPAKVGVADSLQIGPTPFCTPPSSSSPTGSWTRCPAASTPCWAATP